MYNDLEGFTDEPGYFWVVLYTDGHVGVTWSCDGTYSGPADPVRVVGPIRDGGTVQTIAKLLRGHAG